MAQLLIIPPVSAEMLKMKERIFHHREPLTYVRGGYRYALARIPRIYLTFALTFLTIHTWRFSLSLFSL